ncbi:MAG: glycoside hydrolase family 16 protein [Halobacteriovoraceae bacterium]|nr:glycoside hydrolase family 16 protein [Halobacteriovoraceae bacterium]MCB9094003.1 glycoside hydrolase family 16 protein [Halobacteriovoraceae bacterium]
MNHDKYLFYFLSIFTCFIAYLLFSPQNYLQLSSGKRAIASNPTGTQLGWKLWWADEFNGAEEAIRNGAPEECYYNKEPICLQNYGTAFKCRELEEVTNHSLDDLDKCTWSIFHHYNWMSLGLNEEKMEKLGLDESEVSRDENNNIVYGINSFDMNLIEIANGFLNLKARKNDQVNDNTNCKKFGPDGTRNYSKRKDCPVLSGGIWSNPSKRTKGFSFQKGKVEIRAKFSGYPGAFPAHWILPYRDEAQYKYPVIGKGEIDIMEYTFENQGNLFYSFHTSSEEKYLKYNEYRSADEISTSTKERTNNDWLQDFHVYSLEWDDESLTWLVDDKVVKRVLKGQTIHDKGEDHHFRFPDWPYHLILNTTVLGESNFELTDYLNFEERNHYIDYVRVYKRCMLDEEGCIPPKIVRKGSSNVGTYPKGPLLVNPCPKLMKNLGVYKGKNVCKSPLTIFRIKKKNCLKKSRIVWDNYCLKEKKDYFSATHLK